MGLIGNVLHTVFRGGNIVLFSPLDFIHKPVRWLQAIATHGATISAGPNFAYELCINKIPDGELEGLDLSRWRVALNGAEPLRKTTIERFSRKFEACGFRREAFRPCYGLAENTLIATGRSAKSPLRFLPQPDPSPSARDAASRELVSCGTPLRTEVAIVDPIERSPCPPGRVGEIWLAGPSVAGGYWRKPTETEQTFRAFLADGSRGPFLRTGDLGLLDRGELFVTGRLKDLIILRGQNLHPEDIEATVEVEHPALRRGCCAAFAIQRDGEERLVVVQEVRKTHVDPEPIFLAIRRALRREHAVRADDIVLVEARTIPKTTSGKLRRSACKEAYLRGDLAVVASMRRSEEGLPTEAIATDARQLEQVLGRVKAMIAEEVELDPSEVVDSDRIMDLGLDSLAAVTLLEWVEREFRVTVPNEFLLENPSLLELARQMVDLQDLSVPEPRAARTTSERLGLFEGGSPMLKEMDKGLPANLVVQAQERRRLWIQGREVIDFASCNYLGLDQRKEIMQAIPAALAHWGVHPSWTRAVASPEIYDELEAELARTLGVGHVIVFPSISLLNVGVLPLLTAGDGALFLDDIAHNTLRQGCDLAEARGATLVLFPHDDLDILERKLAEHGDRHPKLIVVDGVYSMSGQYADLPAYAALARRHDAFLYVDDAHGFGILGEQPDDELPYGYGGSGLVRHHGLDYTQDRIIYLAGLSKAFSTYAAFMACFDEQMKKRIRLANPYIFSGPIPTASLASGLAGLRLSRADGDITRTRIFSLTKRLVDGLHRVGLKTDNTNYFPIVFVPLGPVAETLRIWKELWKEGFLITPGVFPATPVDRGGVRVSVTAANTEEEIDSLIECLRRLC
jgi:acyl carrier protein